MTYIPTMTQAQVLYDSLLLQVAPTYSGTQVPGFELPNLTDWRDFSLFRSEAAATLTLDMGSDGGWADTIAVWCPGPSVETNGLTIEQSSDGSTWTDAYVMPNITDGVPEWIEYPFVRRFLRFTFAGAADFRQIAVGNLMQFPIGQWNGVNPPTLYQGVIMQNVVSMNGSIIGRNLRRIEKAGKINLTHLTEQWVRQTWNPFAIHAARSAFFYRWNPVEYPHEVAFAVAENIEAPTNDSPPPRMKVGLPVKFLT